MENRPERAPAGPGSRLLAELLATFVLTFVAIGGPTLAARTDAPSNAAQALGPGLVVMAMIYSMGQISGAHLNPVVTLAFALRRDFPWTWVPGYVVAQFAGGLGASYLLKALFGSATQVSVPEPKLGTAQAVVLETVLTALLILVVLGTATRERLLGPNAAVPVAAVIVTAGVIGAPVGAGFMNPALSSGPALATGSPTWLWLYLASPLAGCLVAVTLAFCLFRHEPEEESTAAQGSGH